MSGELVEAIVQAAVDTIRNQEPALTSNAGYVKSITLELELASNGRVTDSVCWIERRGAHRRRRKEPAG